MTEVLSGERPGKDGKIARVSVITVCLNTRSTIEETLGSVREQSFPFIEYVLIDGGSTDGTVEVIKASNPDYFISEPDEGIYYAMQKGANAASGDIVYFLNSGDTFYDKNVISDVVEFFNKTGSDAVFGNLLPCYLSPGDTHDHEAFRDQKMLDLSYFNNRKLFFDESIHHQTIFYRKSIFDHCGFICDNTDANGEYHLNMCAFVSHGYSIKHLPRTICRFALGGKSTSNFSEEWERYTLARDILRKRYFPSGQNIAISSENEYLYYPPSARNRLKILLRRSWYLNIKNTIKHIFKSAPGG
jgi:glycosyltransferase